MSGVTVFLYVLVVIAAVLLIGLILLQPAKSGGMGAAFGGVGESVFGGKAGSHLTKATVYLTAIFFPFMMSRSKDFWKFLSTFRLSTQLLLSIQRFHYFYNQ